MTKQQQGELATVQTVHGTTTRTGPKERSRFQAFKEFFIPRLARQEALGIAYENAVVNKVDAEGEKLIQEAAKLAAEKDLIKQEQFRTFCETVDKSFSANDPQQNVMLKLAKLLETNPEIGNQLEKVNEIIHKLRQDKECRIFISPPAEDN